MTANELLMSKLQVPVVCNPVDLIDASMIIGRMSVVTTQAAALSSVTQGLTTAADVLSMGKSMRGHIDDRMMLGVM